MGYRCVKLSEAGGADELRVTIGANTHTPPGRRSRLP